MKKLENISVNEKNLLLQFPAYISLLACNNNEDDFENDNKPFDVFNHFLTFDYHPSLNEFYQEVKFVFEKKIIYLNNKLPQEKYFRDDVIKNELSSTELVLRKLSKEFALIMHCSMTSFKNHVSALHKNTLENFYFPVDIKGLTY